MLNPQLNNCNDCVSIPALLCSIDKKLAELAKAQYNNIIFELNKKISYSVLSDLINYKTILNYRICNPEYAGCTSIENIAGKVKLLTL